NISKYNDKKLILKVVLSAILINFSKVIAMVIIDVSQLAMSFFSQAISVVGGDFVDFFSSRVGVEYMIKGFDFASSVTYLVVLLLSIVFLFCLTCMIGLLTVVLLFRLVAFWVLIILSPMAMFGLSFPGTAIGSMTKQWFEKMISWAFFGPLMMFFLWLALVVVSVTAAATQDPTIFGNLPSGELEDVFTTVISFIIPYLSAIYLLYYGYDLSKKTSQGAANSVLNWGRSQIGKRGGQLAKGLGIGVAGVAAAPVAAGLYGANMAAGGSKSPLRLKEDLKARYEGAKSRVKNSAAVKPFTKEEGEKRYKEKVAKYSGKTEELERTRNNEEMKKIEDDKSLTKDDVITRMNNTKGSNESRVAAAIHLAKNGHLNDAKNYSAAEQAIALTGNKSLKDTFNKHSKEKNSFGRYMGTIKNKRDEVRGDETYMSVPRTEKEVRGEAKRRAKSEMKKEINKKSLEYILNMDTRFF
ncbi:MAG: hypothetical protein PF549_01400, partial [Patescibacteria group bacterium]|nr:hypothetical protein [Patescibacteria group bacterium]